MRMKQWSNCRVLTAGNGYGVNSNSEMNLAAGLVAVIDQYRPE